MFWSRSSMRERKAVLSALSAVGETGMTLLALGLAVNIPEAHLHAILERLVRAGQVRRRVEAISWVPGQRTPHYHLVSGRHSAAAGRTPAALIVRRSSGVHGG
jgi:DNA-binding IclR family transcriptional regulator